MGLTFDKGFSHKIAEEVLKDSPNNQDAKDILSKPKYRVNDMYFNTEKEAMTYIDRIYPGQYEIKPVGVSLRITRV
jgi:hypothetical protein